jgi:adenylate kinase family enzyme
MGFCLEGYPKTEEQNQYLKDIIKIRPDIVFVLDCPDHIIQQRLKKFKCDPVSGRMYSDSEIKELTSASLVNRLTDLPNETEETIKTR